MDESEFWPRLEFRICDEIAGFSRHRLRRLWCDVVLPDHFVLDATMPRVVGRVWMGISGTTQQQQWGFALLLDGPVASREAIAWADLFPPAGMTRWLSLDPDRRTLVIEPSAAVPDRRP